MDEYIYQKKKLLKQFGIFLRKWQVNYMKSLKTEIAVDNFVRSLILHKLND